MLDHEHRAYGERGCDWERHCYVHEVDEPDGEYGCLECQHVWPNAEALLKDWNDGRLEMRTIEDWPFQPETDPERVPFCPLCLHDF